MIEGGRADCGNHHCFRITPQRILQESGEFAVPVWHMTCRTDRIPRANGSAQLSASLYVLKLTFYLSEPVTMSSCFCMRRLAARLPSFCASPNCACAVRTHCWSHDSIYTLAFMATIIEQLLSHHIPPLVSVRALMTPPRADSDRFIFVASLNRSPELWALPWRSLPARSTRFNLPTRTCWEAC